ncbi:MAG: asparagine synthase (glutamine-hydrolyzing) [Desulfarculus sp.]|nr:asparagine synthase (glutamine-hydrolyzing) [Desulfarculus sp.]
MCGICGFTGKNDREILARMNRAMIHRGPDGEGFYQAEGVNLAMRRLAIVDLDSGQQPQCNESRDLWVVFNGEIYNHKELRARLIKAGHVFASDHSDTETIVHLYEEHGDLWPQVGQVNGMFGLALWDQARRRLLLYRDRIGKKPLYWTVADGELVFASEIKSLLAHPRVAREIDPQALYHYFSLKNISAPRTAFKGIHQLPPGHYLVWEGGKARIADYWRLDFSQPLLEISAEEAAQELRLLLDDAVRLRMDCDAPYGAYLSGGVDSSSVVVLMCRHQQRPVTTFCLGYAEEARGQFEGKAQDIHYARLMSQRLGTDHHEYILDSQEFAASLPGVMRAFDEPFSGTISTFFLSILIHRHVKVALSGDGADELFGSYLSHRLAWPMHHYLALRAQGKDDLGSMSPQERRLLHPFDTPEQFAFLRGVAHPDQSVWRMRLAVFDEPAKRALLTPEFLRLVGPTDSAGLYRGYLDQATARDPLNAVLEVDQRELLANQVLPFMDRLSMAHSIEVRSPFLDHRIIELANRLPGKLKIKDGINKYIHKLAVEPLLPEDLVKRPKEGFVQPIYSWMRASLRPWVEDTLSPRRLKAHGFLRPQVVQGMLERHFAGQMDFSAQIWNLLCFQIWYEEMVSRGWGA